MRPELRDQVVGSAVRDTALSLAVSAEEVGKTKIGARRYIIRATRRIQDDFANYWAQAAL